MESTKLYKPNPVQISEGDEITMNIDDTISRQQCITKVNSTANMNEEEAEEYFTNKHKQVETKYFSIHKPKAKPIPHQTHKVQTKKEKLKIAQINNKEEDAIQREIDNLSNEINKRKIKSSHMIKGTQKLQSVISHANIICTASKTTNVTPEMSPSFYEKTLKWKQNNTLKNIGLQAKKQSKALLNCTFSPKISHKSQECKIKNTEKNFTQNCKKIKAARAKSVISISNSITKKRSKTLSVDNFTLETCSGIRTSNQNH